MNVKPISLSCQPNALKGLYQFEEGRTVVWRERAGCSFVVLFENFIYPGYGGCSQQILNLTNTKSTWGHGGRGSLKMCVH